MGDLYNTEYLANLTQQDYENVNKVMWPWAADTDFQIGDDATDPTWGKLKTQFTRAQDKDLDEFGQVDSVDRLMSEINNGRMHDVDKLIDDEIIKQETIIIDTQSTDSVKGILEENNLTRLFFSPQNIEAIQRMIRYYVHKLTNGQIVSKQSPDELFVIMRSILLQYGNFLSSGIINEIKRLNSKVVTICAEKVSTEVSQYNHYINDLQKLPTPLENPHYVNKNNFTYDISNLPQ